MVNVENHQFLNGNCKLLVIWVEWKQSVCSITLLYSSTFYNLFLPFFFFWRYLNSSMAGFLLDILPFPNLNDLNSHCGKSFLSMLPKSNWVYWNWIIQNSEVKINLYIHQIKNKTMQNLKSSRINVKTIIVALAFDITTQLELHLQNQLKGYSLSITWAVWWFPILIKDLNSTYKRFNITQRNWNWISY